MADNAPVERLIRLSPNLTLKGFDCEDDDLNEFFLRDSKNFSQKLLAATYILENNDETIAFFSIFNDKISAHEIKGQSGWELWKSEVFLDIPLILTT